MPGTDLGGIQSLSRCWTPPPQEWEQSDHFVQAPQVQLAKKSVKEGKNESLDADYISTKITQKKPTGLS